MQVRAGHADVANDFALADMLTAMETGGETRQVTIHRGVVPAGMADHDDIAITVLLAYQRNHTVGGYFDLGSGGGGIVHASMGAPFVQYVVKT